MKRYPTGILNLDSQIGGGFPEGSVILILEDPGAGAEIISFYFVVEGLKNNESILYITTNDTSDEIKESLKLYFNLSDDFIEKIKFLDLMSSRISTGISSRDFPTLFGDSYNRVMNEILRGNYDRVVINNLAYFAENYDRKSVTTLLENLAIAVRRKRAVALVLLSKGMLDSQFETAIKHAVDGIIEMCIREAENEVQRRMKIIKLKRTLIPKNVFRYEIIDKGIKMESVTRVL